MKDHDRDGEKLGAVFLLGVVLLSPLLVRIFDGDADVAVFGVPLLYLYLFVVWGVLIALMAVVTERKSADAGMMQEPRSNDLGDHLVDK